MLGEFVGDGRGRSRSTSEPHGPVGLADPLRVELTDHTHDAIIEQSSVATGDGLLRGSGDFGQATEGRSRIDV